MATYRSHVLVCAGAGCVSSGCKAVQQALVTELEANDLQDEVRVVETGCIGSCDLGPVVVVYPEGVFLSEGKSPGCNGNCQRAPGQGTAGAATLLSTGRYRRF